MERDRFIVASNTDHRIPFEDDEVWILDQEQDAFYSTAL